MANQTRKSIFLCSFFLPSGIGGPLIVLLACVVVQYGTGTVAAWFLYDRAALVEGQLWRLFSGHLVHSNDAHLLLNAGAVIALWLLHGQHYRLRAYLWLFALISMAVGIGLWLWFAEVEQYCGLSGVLHGLFCWGAFRDIAQRRFSGVLLLIGCYLKVAWEQMLGPSTATAALIEADVAVSSHLLGALAGTAIGLLGVSATAWQPLLRRV